MADKQEKIIVLWAGYAEDPLRVSDGRRTHPLLPLGPPPAGSEQALASNKTTREYNTKCDHNFIFMDEIVD